MKYFRYLVIIMMVAAIAGIIYLLIRIQRFTFVKKIKEKNRILGWLMGIPVLAVITVPYVVNSPMAAVVVLIHLLAFMVICDITGFIANKILKRKKTRYYAGAAAFAITFVFLLIGEICARNVWIKRYEIDTAKNVGEGVYVAALSDSHLGYTMSGKKFAREIEKLQKYSPDALIILGDFVDDDTPREDMETACEALGKLQTRYGVYYVYGNHDRGYSYYRNFNEYDLLIQLRKNGVIILEDKLEYITLDAGDGSEPAVLTLAGRKDRSRNDRKSAVEMMKDTDPSSYTIMLDHQPNDYDNEAEAGPDLVLSGHTHGGQMFPVNLIGQALGANDRHYGMERRNNTDFIVTSGIAEWAIPFKTCCVSEILLLHIY